MPAAAAAAGNDGGNVQISDRERDKDIERDREKSSKNKLSSKVKDLSHVPCKFFKVGACTAGSSCPFSHSLQEPGGHKEVCAWYVKGNCKFGHKCALAHVMPGQSMAMDRKNKKAAQVAAGNASGGKDAGKGIRVQKREVKPLVGLDGSPSTLASHPRNPLLSGSTAPTRVLPSSSRPPLPMPLKATISPSAPAPALKDTDFALFELPDESNKLSTPSSHGKPPSQHEPMRTNSDTPKMDVIAPQENQPSPGSSPLPMSTPCAPHRLGVARPSSPGPVDFGPIGSPPRSIGSAGQQARINGFSPGTSPSHNTGFASSSPFSAPGTQTVFLSYENDAADLKARSGIAASLGANRTWMTDFPLPSQVTTRTDFDLKLLGGEIVVEDEDLEDFLPSSLTDLLTVEERSRRMSRSNSGQPAVTAIRDLSAQRSNIDGPYHRYSRSVPAPSLLSEIKSIWADSTSGLPASPEANANTAGLPFAGRLSSGTPSSYKSNTGFGGRSFREDTLSPPVIPPSNASAAFLPGLHHHYLNSKAGSQHPSSGRGTGATNNASAMTLSAFSANPFVTAGGIAISPPQTQPFGNRPSFESATPDSNPTHLPPPGRPIPSNTGSGGDAGEGRSALSPSARALQAHAPGQSLPQGLAAGYSRIHALPPPPVVPSPSGSAFSPGKVSAYSSGANGHDWASTSDIALGLPGIGVTSSNSGLESMFSRLSYPTAVSRAPNSSSNSSPAVSSAVHAQAPGIVRNVSGRNWQNHGPFSPLSGPVLTGDDDDLFSMDG